MIDDHSKHEAQKLGFFEFNIRGCYYKRAGRFKIDRESNKAFRTEAKGSKWAVTAEQKGVYGSGALNSRRDS